MTPRKNQFTLNKFYNGILKENSSQKKIDHKKQKQNQLMKKAEVLKNKKGLK